MCYWKCVTCSHSVTEVCWAAAELRCSEGRSRPRKELALKGPSEREPSLCTCVCMHMCVSCAVVLRPHQLSRDSRYPKYHCWDIQNVMNNVKMLDSIIFSYWLFPSERRQPITCLHLPLSQLTYIHFHNAHKSPLWLEQADRRPSSSNLRILRVVLIFKKNF